MNLQRKMKLQHTDEVTEIWSDQALWSLHDLGWKPIRNYTSEDPERSENCEEKTAIDIIIAFQGNFQISHKNCLGNKFQIYCNTTRNFYGVRIHHGGITIIPLFNQYDWWPKGSGSLSLTSDLLRYVFFLGNVLSMRKGFKMY